MADILLTNEPLIRLAFFLGILVLMMAWEFAAPRRRQTVSRWVRWPNNLAVVVLNTVFLRITLFPTNATSMFNHGNVRIPPSIDQALRWLVVTPDMHRVHHSVIPTETNSNFGFNLPWWDRLCGTYRAQPAAGHEGMTIGIEQFRTVRELWLDRMLLRPFWSKTGNYLFDAGESPGGTPDRSPTSRV
jgi:hypothetical protein